MNNDSAINTSEVGAGNLQSYMIGYALSIAFTLAAYMLVVRHVVSDHTFIPHNLLILVVVTLAIAQLIVQLVFFLHLGRKSGSSWNLIAFLYTTLLVVFLVGGSLWIMYHLNYNMTHMPPAQVDAYMVNQ